MKTYCPGVILLHFPANSQKIQGIDGVDGKRSSARFGGNCLIRKELRGAAFIYTFSCRNCTLKLSAIRSLNTLLRNRRSELPQLSRELASVIGGRILQLLEKSINRLLHLLIGCSIFRVGDVQGIQRHSGLLGATLPVVGDVVGIG